MRARPGRLSTDNPAPILVVPGFERLKSRLRPGQYLRAQLLRYLDERNFLLRLLGRTVVATSTKRLAENSFVWVRVKSIKEKVHLQLVYPPTSTEAAAGTRTADATTPAVTGVGFLQLSDGQKPIKVVTERVPRRGEGKAWSVVLQLENEPRASLRFTLDAKSNSLAVRLVSDNEELVERFIAQRRVVEEMVTRRGFANAGVGASRSAVDDEPAAGGLDFGRGLDLLI